MTVTLQDAINVIQAGDLARGKTLLAQVLQQDPSNEAAWIWMSGTVEDIDQRRYCLEKALEINPDNAAAQAGLARLGVQPPNAVPPTPLARKDHGLGQPSTGAPPTSPEEPAPEQPSATPAFVWPAQEETDEESTVVEETFIGDIVAAMNKDESSTPPTQDTDLNWLFQSPDETGSEMQSSEQGLRDMSDGLEPETSAEISEQELSAEPPAPEVSEEPSADQPQQQVEPTPGSGFSGLEPAEIAALKAAATPSPGQMWRDPNERSRRVVILTDRYLVGATIDLNRLTEIETMLQANQVLRSLLGHSARIIPIDRIISLQANPDFPTLQVSYLVSNNQRRQTFTLASVAQRDEVVEAFKSRHGAQFHTSIQKTNLWDAVAVPGLTLILLAMITGLLYFWATDLLLNADNPAAWLPDSFINWLTSNTDVNLPLYVVLVGGGLMLLVMLWLLLTLRKPGRTLVLKRKPEETHSS